MQIDRLLYPVHSLGPGDRLAIWIRGCKKRCFNCANPELQLFNPNSEVSMTVIKEMISKIDKKLMELQLLVESRFAKLRIYLK